MPSTPNAIEHIARYAIGNSEIGSRDAERIMSALGFCKEARGIFVIANTLLKEATEMAIDPALLTELISLIKDVIEKARRDRLIELVNDFFSKYVFVLRMAARMENRREECFKKDDEVSKHLQEAKNAAKAGDANALQEAIAKATDDLEELAECLGIEIMPF